MKIYRPFEKEVPTRGVITLGFFDGVHIGHQAILRKVKADAKELDANPLVLTLWPHPRIVLGKNDDELLLINTLDEKTSLIARNGLEHFVVIPFTTELSNLSAEDFFKTFFVDWLKIRKLIVGYDHHIGKNGTGDFTTMQRLGLKFEVEVEKVEAQTHESISISSTKIRNLILLGDVSKASKYLGYNYFLTGIVEKGFQVGRKIGFPTANIRVLEKHKIIPADGVYAVKVLIDGLVLNGMLNIGYRPTISKDQHKTIEVNIFNFDSSIYGSTISIQFVSRIRNEMKFEGIEVLKKQLEQDRNAALQILSSDRI
ncbi:riboflavin biosynthesis protein RibF [uncultured Acetobacteroides sp.]|uniref:riboflavin biosynthesis protein RibF n=1 Tax=uncultured Acetobacteroides sp. TaxID=1760811 RepID=UPI0029F4AEF0|nr:riboflavin biosynthesis protein RibF [uncultured Acetobacteroides sp.]